MQRKIRRKIDSIKYINKINRRKSIKKEEYKHMSISKEKYEIINVKKKEDKIIIVGNGPSVLNKELGEKIDNFDKVVGINNFQIEGFEKYVGTKVDIWCKSDSTMIPHVKDFKFEQILWFIPSISFKKNCKIPMELGGNNALVGIETINRLHSTLFEKYPNKAKARTLRPTTGMFTILYFLELYNDITIYGFDCFEGHENGIHYFEDFKKQNMNGHDVLWEKVYIRCIINNNEIKGLS